MKLDFNTKFHLLVVVCLTILCALTASASASAQDLASEEELYEGKEFASAFADPNDDPDLPNVLLIGDSISNAYTVDVRKLLVGKADVFRIPSNGKYASFGSKNLNKWLGIASGMSSILIGACGTFATETQSQKHKDIETRSTAR